MADHDEALGAVTRQLGALSQHEQSEMLRRSVELIDRIAHGSATEAAFAASRLRRLLKERGYEALAQPLLNAAFANAGEPATTREAGAGTIANGAATRNLWDQPSGRPSSARPAERPPALSPAALPLAAAPVSSAVVRPRPPVEDEHAGGPGGWMRRRRAGREARRNEAAGARTLTRLGPHWHIVDRPAVDPDAAADRAGFLAIGPGGVFSVTVADHGRSRVMIAGDVVQINGKRPAYVVGARREARRAARGLSAAVGLSVPVTPVLNFVGSGVISVHGLPKEVLVATERELDRLLIAGGNRMSPGTAGKLSAIARNPQTWAEAS